MCVVSINLARLNDIDDADYSPGAPEALQGQ
jgi:hypothetical protein